MKKQQKIFLIANAHVDPIWQWEEDEGIFAALSTYRSAINLLNEFDFVFCHNESYIYEKIEQLDKELFEEIKLAVKKGKWIIMGGWYLQPDCLMPKGESIVRQVLVGKKYFLEKFGVEPKTAINLDPFGHSRGLVQIINKCNQTGCIITRPSKVEFGYPSECFEWVGYDGSVIKVYHCSSYSTPLGCAGSLIKNEINERKGKNPNDFIKLWGLGNHGGGPSRRDLRDIKAINDSLDDVELIHSSPDDALSQIQAEGTVLTSLNNCNIGCYTSMSKLKRKYLQVERLYYQVEKMASVASMSGMDYPLEELDYAMKSIMLCQFHDLLPGTCTKTGEDYVLSVLGDAENKLKKIRMSLVNYLCDSGKPANESEYPVFVFNELPYKVKKYVECELCVIPECVTDEETVLHVKDANGNEVLSQRTKEDSNVNMDWRKRIGFYAELEPLSFTRFDIFVTYKKIEGQKEKVNIVNDFIVNTKNGSVTISGKTGAIKEYIVDGKKYLDKDAFALFAYDDNEDPWGHVNTRYASVGKNPKEFNLGGIGIFEGQSNVKVVEDGSIFTVIESLYNYKQTQAVVQYKIFKEDSRVDIKVGIVLANKNIIVKAHIPVGNKEVVSGQMFGAENVSSLGNETIAQEYVKVPFDSKSLNISLFDSYGVSYDKENLKFSLVRGATYCAHPIANKPVIDSGRFIPTIDLGLAELNFTMFVSDEEKVGGLTRQFNQSYAIQLFPSGKGETTMPNINLNDSRILLEAFKKKDGGKGYVVRLFNSTDKVINCELACNENKANLTFNKYEVKTLELNDIIYENNGMSI